jgi:uncharacterized protein YndB with AHSA1/START domain
MARLHEGNDATTIVQEVTISAPKEVVWKALTDPDQLVRWFPLGAHVIPGKGGSVKLTWGDFTEDSTIEIWQPDKHLQLKENVPFSVPLEPAELKTSAPRVVDFQFEGDGSKTVLRLTHSGFAVTPVRAELSPEALDRVQQTLELSPLGFRNVVADCWKYQLLSLGDYVENHLNQNRTVSWVRQPIQGSFEEAWSKLSGPATAGSSAKGLLHAEGAKGHRSAKTSLTGLQVGDQYSFTAVTGDTFTGKVLSYKQNKQFVGTVENLNGIVRLLFSFTIGRPDVTVWLARYSSDADLASTQTWAKLFEARWTTALARAFA